MKYKIKKLEKPEVVEAVELFKTIGIIGEPAKAGFFYSYFR